MPRYPNPPKADTSDARLRALDPGAAKVAQRLLAHARLCREIAEQTWNEDSAEGLERLAQACIRAADDILHVPPSGRLH